MALMTTARADVVGPSPPDLMPNGFVGENTSLKAVENIGKSWALGKV